MRGKAIFGNLLTKRNERTNENKDFEELHPLGYVRRNRVRFCELLVDLCRAVPRGDLCGCVVDCTGQRMINERKENDYDAHNRTIAYSNKRAGTRTINICDRITRVQRTNRPYRRTNINCSTFVFPDILYSQRRQSISYLAERARNRQTNE